MSLPLTSKVTDDFDDCDDFDDLIGRLMGSASEFIESFLKALAKNKRTDSGVTKIEIFLSCISLECHKSQLNMFIGF